MQTNRLVQLPRELRVRRGLAFERLVVHDKRPALVADGGRVVFTLALLWDALWRGARAEEVQFGPAGVELEVGACGVVRVVRVRRGGVLREGEAHHRVRREGAQSGSPAPGHDSGAVEPATRAAEQLHYMQPKKEFSLLWRHFKMGLVGWASNYASPVLIVLRRRSPSPPTPALGRHAGGYYCQCGSVSFDYRAIIYSSGRRVSNFLSVDAAHGAGAAQRWHHVGRHGTAYKISK